ncbi:MAG: M20/M25/M40 family metallo-hydrolase [Clostridia bacterium]|nr:M20/M25/M40 family metallo-hydrolase [Clostridia bacterium]
MKLNDLDLNPVAKIRESTNFTVREIRKVCKTIGPRAAGSESEDKAQEYILENCAKFADSAEKETFKLAPRAFMAWPWLGATVEIIAILLYIASAFVPQPMPRYFQIGALALTGIILVLIALEFLFYKQVFDPFFKKAQSSNVLLTKKPTGEVKRRIIFSGHIDSAYEWRFTHWGGYKLLRAAIYSALGCLVVCLVLDILTIAVDFPDGVLFGFRIAEGVCIVGLCVGFVFDNPKLVVEGANDDLTGVFSSIAVLQFLTTNNISFENTEVIAVSMGSEESGLRGAKALANAHKFDDVETVFVASDTVRDMEFMGVYNKDMSGTVKLDKNAVQLMLDAAHDAGLELPKMTVELGATDAAAMMQGGIPSVAFCAMDHSPAQYYHTRTDTADNLNIQTIEKGIEVLIRTALLFDERGLSSGNA